MNPVTGRADYFGNSVNRAARVVTLGRGGETLVTDSVFFEVESDAMFRQTLFATYHGQHKLRGFDDETTVFSLLPKTLQDREQYLAKDSNKDTKTSDTKTSRVLAAWEAPTPNSSVGASEILQKKKKGPQKELVDASAVLQDIDDTIVEGAEMTMRTALPSVDEAKRERQRQLKSNMEELIAEVQNTETLRDQLRSDNHTREKRLKQSRERVGSMMLEIKAKEKRLFSEIRRQLVFEQRSDRATQRVNATNNEADMTEHKSKALNEERQQLHEWIMETAVYANRNDKDDGDSRYLAQIQESTAEAKRSAESLAKVEQDHAEQLTQLDAIRAEMAVYERKQGLEAASKVEAYRALIQAENGSENMLKLISGAQLELELIKTEKERQGEEITRLGSLIALAKSPEQLAAVLNDPSLTRGDGSKEAADSVYQAKAAQFQLKDLRKTFRAEMTSKGETLADLYRLLARSVLATQSLRSVILGEYASIRPLSGRRAIEKQMTVMHQTSSTVRFADESQSATPRSPQTRSPRTPQTRSPRTPRKRSPSQSPQVARSPKGTEKSQPTQVAVVPFSDTGGALRSEESSVRRTGSRHVARRNRAKSTGDARPRSVGTINMQARKGRAEVVKTEAAMASPRYLSTRGDHKPAERRLPAVRDRRKVEAELHLITTDDWFSTSET